MRGRAVYDLCRFPGGDGLRVFCFHVRVELRGDESRHVEGAADAGPSAVNKGAAGPASGLARDGSKTCKARGLSGFEGSKFGHFDQEREGGEPGDAGNANQDREAFGEAKIRLDAAIISASMAAI